MQINSDNSITVEGYCLDIPDCDTGKVQLEVNLFGSKKILYSRFGTATLETVTLAKILLTKNTYFVAFCN